MRYNRRCLLKGCGRFVKKNYLFCSDKCRNKYFFGTKVAIDGVPIWETEKK